MSSAAEDNVLHIRCTGELAPYAGDPRKCNRWLATLDVYGVLVIACPKCKALHPVKLADLVEWLSKKDCSRFGSMLANYEKFLAAPHQTITNNCNCSQNGNIQEGD